MNRIMEICVILILNLLADQTSESVLDLNLLLFAGSEGLEPPPTAEF